MQSAVLPLDLSLLWIGGAWIWLPDLAGLSGILPAVFVTPFLAARKRFLEPRTGYVQWRGPRREWERRSLWAVLMAGIGIFLGGVVLFLLAGVFAFMEKVFKLYLKFRGYPAEYIKANLPELKQNHHSAWYWIRTGFFIAPLFVWVLIRYIKLLNGI